MGEFHEGEDSDWFYEIPTKIFLNIVRNENSFERLANPGPSSATNFEENYVNSDYLDNPPGSDVDEKDVRKFSNFNQPKNSDEVRFKVDMKFNTKAMIKNAIKNFATETEKNLYFNKNDGDR